MERWCLFLVFAALSNQALGFSVRNKRQAEGDNSNTDKDLEDRYGWNRPTWQGRPNQGGQWLFPFPFPMEQLPGQGQGQGQTPGQNQGRLPGQSGGQTSTPSPNGNGSTTQSSSVQECIRTCPVTSEYNPVCGSDGVTYTNPGRLGCAQACGKKADERVSVNLLRASRCPGSIQSN